LNELNLEIKIVEAEIEGYTSQFFAEGTNALFLSFSAQNNKA
jgi:hypothetical protein